MNDTPTVIGAFVTIILAFLGVAKIMLNQATKDREANRAERQKLSEAIELMAGGMEKVADSNIAIATETSLSRKVQEKGFDEAKDRNGHLAELVMQQGEIAQKLADTATEKIINAVGMQHVDVQKVEHQTVKEVKKG